MATIVEKERKDRVKSKDMKTSETSAMKSKKKAIQKSLSNSYNEFKEFEGRQYSGMQIGRSHHWNYDQGDWKETKITPDLWEISYAVTKRRKGHAPEGSGVPVGTEYHWYILAHQNVRKLNANDYATSMTGLKFKLAHNRADKDKWSLSGPTQRQHLVKFLKSIIAQLDEDPVPPSSNITVRATKEKGYRLQKLATMMFVTSWQLASMIPIWASSAVQKAAGRWMALNKA